MSTLYIVATPIGNLEDITLRALRILKEVDFILCEDTRVTSHLLARYEIQKPLVTYFQHSKLSKVEEIIGRLQRGENAALVTDAGTPGISDPGGVLVHHIMTTGAHDIKVVPIPGPSAVITALSISGLPTDKFIFMGFPPHKKGRQTFFKKVAEAEETVVFYESPHRIIKSLEQLKMVLDSSAGGRIRSNDIVHDILRAERSGVEKRKVVVCRELTKMFESVYRGTMENILELVQKDPVKGEYVVVVGN